MQLVADARHGGPRETPVAERVLPHSVDAEQALLGGLLLDNPVLYRLPSEFSANEFFLDQHRLIFNAVARVLDAGRPADAVTVYNALVAQNEHERAGGLSYLNSLSTNTPSAANAVNYARIVSEHAHLRRIIRAAEESLAIAWAGGNRNPAEVIDEIEARVQAVSDGEGERKDFVDAREMVDVGLQWFLDAHEGRRRGLSTGLVDLDRVLGVGLEPGNLFVIGGRPSSGKTALALNLALAVAKQGRGACVFSMEMSTAQLAGRLLAGEAKINHGALRKGQIRDSEFGPLTTAGERLAELPLFINQHSSPDIDQIRVRSRKLARQTGSLGVIVVDYLQLMRLPKAENMTIGLGEVTKALKHLAGELKVTVILLSQLNRESDKRLTKRPVMSDLRQSGAIEQDADVIVFVHRDEQAEPNKPEANGTAELIVAKNRDGEVGTVLTAFRGEYSRFENLAHSV